ncbi:uncharacterized protein LOC119107277 [Pollicipes pollicipes]|uniref:uncharacterized protein LOC119107274 n=1 Tax=Pollicipes pollicipes TaxID=41117 RepID=UPI001884956F|nr:uncharacterized protein LOC119107274 [Pollicipes pollicipes]XP_037086594.1 uncharacterized protein LOC119107277 [Pollicipes pollicipes]
MSHREGGQFASVAGLGDLTPKTHKSARAMAEKFCRSTFAATHGYAASRVDRRLPMAALRSCAYSLHATEQLLRESGRPLLAEPGSRAHLCLAQLVRLCSTLTPLP